MRGSVLMMRRALTATIASLVLASVVSFAHADTTFDTTPSWNGSSSISPWGFSNTATYGQTFIAPADTTFTDFTFYVDGGTNVSLNYKAAVYSWSGSLLGGGGGGATGSALYLSGTNTYVGDNTFQALTFTPNVTVIPGQQYVAFLTISDPADYANSTGATVWGDILFTHVANSGGGGFVFYNNGNNFGALNTTAWDNFGDFGDLAWKANFVGASAVPEPGAVATGVILFGGLGLGLIRGRRSRKS